MNRFFNGIVDEVRIYDRALTAPEIMALYTAGNQSAAAWHRRYYGNATINWMADDDGDGLTRLGEYAFGGEPHISDSQGIRIVPSIVDGHLQIRFRRRQFGTHELTYQIQQSSSLGSWSVLSGSEVATPSATAGFEEVTFHAAATVSSPGAVFVRLTASLP